jgi:MoxR-like ATPase
VVVTSNATSLSQLPVAIRDRFPVAIYIDQPHPDAVATLSPDLQASASAATCAPFERRISMRAFSAFDRLRVSLGTPRAAELVFGRERARDVLDALEIAALS